jgi:CheY-like chemotaxis protein
VLKDLRGPLTTIIGSNEMLLREAHDEKQNPHLQNIENASREITETLTKVGSMLKHESDKPHLQKSKILRKHLLKRLEKMIGDVSKHHSTQIDADIHIPEEFELDETALIQTLSPIYKTAHELGHSREILRLKLSQQTDTWFYLKISLTKYKTTKSEDLEKIFNEQFPHDIDDIYAMDLIEAFGSSLKVAQNEESVTISFFVKANKTENDVVNKEAHHFPAGFNKDTRVLLVEDNSLNQLVTKLMVESLGCSVDLANNGRKALELYDPSVHDCIFMDIEMPVMNGLEATAALREKYGNDFPIIGLSADAMGGDMKKHQSLGFSDYLIKPVKIETLANKIYHWTVTKKNISA